MTLNSIYSLAFSIPEDGSAVSRALSSFGKKSKKVDGDVYVALIKNEPNLRLLSCNTRKHGKSSGTGGSEVWTLISSPKFGTRYKGPQENLPAGLVDEVSSLMISSLEQSLGLKDASIEDQVDGAKLQLWGAGVPLNTWRSGDDDADGFLYDAEYGAGTCGDWLLDPSVAGAWESGRRLAEWMVQGDAGKGSNGKKEGQSLSVGLPPKGSFVPSRAASESGIGTIRSRSANGQQTKGQARGGGGGKGSRAKKSGGQNRSAVNSR